MKKLILLLLVSPIFCLAQISFADISAEAGINNTGSNRGISIGDYNNDGRDDIYVSIQNQSNMLYENQSDGQFIDVAPQLGLDYEGVTRASLWIDINNDGWLDLFLANFNEPNSLFLNNGDNSFTDISASAGIGITDNPRSINAADIDKDGFIDIYVANLASENALFRNNGNNTFTNIIFSTGATDTNISMGAIFFDYDNDGDSDLYLTHDADQPNILYQNQGNGNFVDVSVQTGTNYAGQGMGVDFGDVNNDGFLDLYITNLSTNVLLLNNQGQNFIDISSSANVFDPGMGWSTTWLDYNNDSYQDIFMVNDSYFAPLPNILYENQGDSTFINASENTALDMMFGSYGMASTDFDSDGRVDIVIANNGNEDGNQLFRNETENNNFWLKIKCIGTESNRMAIGTRVEVEVDGQFLVDEICAGSGYSSQNSSILHFGLGDTDIIDKITVKWPSGIVEIYELMYGNNLYQFTESEGLTTSLQGSLPTQNPDIQMSISPNPTEDSAQIQVILKEPETFECRIYDVYGKILFLKKYKAETRNQLINIDCNYANGEKWAGGLYFVEITAGDNIQTSILSTF